MEALSQICDPHLFKRFKIGANLAENKIIDMLREVAPTFNETMLYCNFRSEKNSCRNYFEEIMTDEGLCFTFNMLNAKELYRDEYGLIIQLNLPSYYFPMFY